MVYVNYFRPNINKFTDPFIIYETSIPNVVLKYAACTTDTVEFGYQCVLHLRKITITDQMNNVYNGSNSVLLVSFLSSGSVTKIKKLYGDFATADAVAKFALPNGGYLLMYRKTVDPFYLLIYGEIFNPDDVFHSRWDIPTNFIIPFPYVVIYNNVQKTFETISEITPKYFTIISSSIPRFNNNNGKFYYFIYPIYI